MKCISQASFWRPDYVVESAWLEHAPFSFWLIDSHRPNVVVELGAHRGFSYCCFCQAISRLNLSSRAYAVDTWEGDEHAGFYGESIHLELSAYNERYSAFSRLMRSTFDEALPHFEDSSIDLLHIDGRHFYDDVKHEFESWLPKLSRRGVVLFHDTNVRERGFGVFKLWAEIRDRYPSFEFIHGHGLGVTGIGKDQTAEMQELFATSGDPVSVQAVLLAYETLGTRVSLMDDLNREQEAHRREQEAHRREQEAHRREQEAHHRTEKVLSKIRKRPFLSALRYHTIRK